MIEAFLKTEMGEGCRLMTAAEFRKEAHGLGGPDLQGALFSPHELRVESRSAIAALATWLRESLGIVFFNETVVFDATPPVMSGFAAQHGFALE